MTTTTNQLTPQLLESHLQTLVAACGPGVQKQVVAIDGTERDERGYQVPFRWKRLLFVHVQHGGHLFHVLCDVDLRRGTDDIQVWYHWKDVDAWFEPVKVTLQDGLLVDVSQTQVPLYPADRASAHFLEELLVKLGIDPAPLVAHVA